MTRPAGKPNRRMLAPIWLDQDDQEILENLRVWLWARTRQDAILHSLRWALIVIKKTPSYYKPFVRESELPWSEGKSLTLRLTEDQREHLEAFREITKCDNNAEAVRIIIRMAEHFYRHH